MGNFNKKIVLVGGGVGAAAFTRALSGLTPKITTIVSSFDNGGSTGIIRRDYGGWAVGDFRNCLIASAGLSDLTKAALNFRFGPGQFQGLQVGNILVKAVLDNVGNFKLARAVLKEIFKNQTEILPISISDSVVIAKLSNGRLLQGQREIAEYLSFSRAPIQKIGLTGNPKILAQAKTSMLKADYLFFAPGHFFTSLLPHLSVQGFAESWARSKAKKVWFVNLLAHRGQDSYYKLVDYLKWFQKGLGQKPFDIIVYNTNMPKKLTKQLQDHFLPIKVCTKDLQILNHLGIKVMGFDLRDKTLQIQHPNDLIKRAPVRHDPNKILSVAKELLKHL